jgi:hypothetical protein
VRSNSTRKLRDPGPGRRRPTGPDRQPRQRCSAPRLYGRAALGTVTPKIIWRRTHNPIWIVLPTEVCGFHGTPRRARAPATRCRAEGRYARRKMIIAHDLSPVGILLHAGRDRRRLKALAVQLERSLERPRPSHPDQSRPNSSIRAPSPRRTPASCRARRRDPAYHRRLPRPDFADHRLAEHGRAILTLYHQLVQGRRATIGRASGSPTHEFALCHFSQRTVP